MWRAPPTGAATANAALLKELDFISAAIVVVAVVAAAAAVVGCVAVGVIAR